MPRVVQHLLLLTCVGAATFFVNLGGPRLWDRDEPRNAACAREMLERGDWVVPTFNGELRVPKPILKYWLMITRLQAVRRERIRCPILVGRVCHADSVGDLLPGPTAARCPAPVCGPG